MGNRVEDLESKVASLQATVDGLTEELVETKERLRRLEAETDVDVDAPTRETDGNPHAEVMPDATESESDDGVNSTDGEESTADEESETDDNDIIVA